MKLAVIVFNLGGPDSLEAVEPFLVNLFSDPAIISLPGFVRRPLARAIARRRAPFAKTIYARMGGRSPILQETETQARALERELEHRGAAARVFIAMRAWKPFGRETVAAVAQWGPDRVVLLPLYPQFSTTTTASSLAAWREACVETGFVCKTDYVCCYPWDSGFVATVAELTRDALAQRKGGMDYRVLFSAHGLPKRTIARGDPYQWQIERSVEAIVEALAQEDLDWRISYQSRVGPLEWIGPATDKEIEKAGAEGKGLIVVPVSFVSEHSETLVELDIDYAGLAARAGVPDYLRVSTVRAHPRFIEGLGRLVMLAAAGDSTMTCGEGRICPGRLSRCGWENRWVA